MKTIYLKKDSPIINIRIIVPHGSVSEKHGGAAHFLEHMFFKGTHKHTYKELNKITSSLGDINAYTYYNKTVFHITCLKKNFEKAKNILNEMFFDSFFKQEEFDKEKNVILEEYKATCDNPNNFFWNGILQDFYDVKPIIGNHESISSMTLKDLYDFKDEFYHKAIMCITGIEDSSEIEYPEVTPIVQKFNLADYSFSHTSEQARIALCYPYIGFKDSYRRVSDIFSNILGGGMHSCLFQRIREELGLAYSVGCFTQDMVGTNAFVISAMIDKKNVMKTKNEILNVIENLKTFSDEELLDTAKNNVLYSISDVFQTSVGYASICHDAYFDRGIKFNYETTVKDIESVTCDDIQRHASVLFNSNKFCVMNG